MTPSLILRVAGGALALIGLIWGKAGYYSDQAPVVYGLILGGAALFFVGEMVKDRTEN
ncbi:MAG: hypothetical protein ACYCTH_12870 [Cellulomonas sp.]